MRLPKFTRRLRHQQREAELLMRDRPRRRKREASLDDASEWDDGLGVEAMREIRELYGVERRGGL